MQKSIKLEIGDSIDNAIIIDAPNSILGVHEEYEHIDRICSSQDENVKSVEQTLIIKNQKNYDRFVIKMMDGTEKTIFFDVSSFFGKI